MAVLKKFLLLIGQLLLVTFLVFTAREAWLAYVQETENEQFARESIPVTVRVKRILKDKRDWKDYIGYSKYVDFSFHGKTYTLRYLPDSGWVGQGTAVRLLYSSSLDRFLQPGRLLHPPGNVKISKLINWSVVGTFSYAHRWLFGFLILATISGLLCFSILFNLTGWILFDFLARIIKVVCAAGMLVYFTWNVFSNYRYYQRVQNGSSQQATITETEKRTVFNQGNENEVKFYYYAAMVPDATAANGQRRIMISESDYSRYRAGDKLPVYYQSSMDEMMSVDYSFERYKWVFVGVMWIIGLYLIFTARKAKIT